MKYFRLDDNNKIIEVFSYNVFEWIPNKDFLSRCYEVDTDVDVKQGMYYIDGQFVVDLEKPEETITEIEEIQQNITDLELNDIEQGQMITELELMILGGVK